MRTGEFMCDRPNAMTNERLEEIERELSTGATASLEIAYELTNEIRELWDDKLSMIPMEQA